MIQSPVKLLSALVAAWLLAACAGLPDGVPRAPADDPAAGILTLPSGRALPVYPQELKYSGEAHYRWPDGRTYEGEWINGRPHGTGTEARPDGTRYRGQWQAGRHHGQGELTEPDGGRYVGEFDGGLRAGTGTFSSADGVYRGGWAADLPHGEGAFEGADGTRYDGQWRRGQRFGYGRYETPDGAGYEGDWAYDEPHGFGRLEDGDGGSYEGQWQQGERHGYGRAEGPPGLIYEGTWAAGEKQGFGREQRPDGSSYTGEWEAGKRHGQGLEVRPDGSFHDGTWELNQVLGPGQRRAPTGIEISGLWNGDAVSTGLLKLPTGPEYAGPLFAAGGTRASPRLLTWLHATAGRGDPYAHLMLGTLFLDMEQPPRDVDRARQWLTRAAEAGIAEAQFRLALTYEEVNPPRVVDLLSRAGNQSHARANETLGEYYYGGITVPRNLERAIGYFQHAVDAGSVTARNNLAWLLATADDPRQRDGDRAVALIRPIALYSGRWQYLDTLAAAWAAAGQFDKASATAQRAMEAADRQADLEATGQLAALEQRLAGYRRGEAYVEPPPGAAGSRAFNTDAENP